MKMDFKFMRLADARSPWKRVVTNIIFLGFRIGLPDSHSGALEVYSLFKIVKKLELHSGCFNVFWQYSSPQVPAEMAQSY